MTQWKMEDIWDSQYVQAWRDMKEEIVKFYPFDFFKLESIGLDEYREEKEAQLDLVFWLLSELCNWISVGWLSVRS